MHGTVSFLVYRVSTFPVEEEEEEEEFHFFKDII
jgi:hypothetical protein